MIDLTEKRVSAAIKNLSKTNAKGETPIARYLAVQALLADGKVVQSFEFQRRFNAFYRVRRSENWRRSFFKTFQKCRDAGNADFSDVIVALHGLTGRVEASFASKLVASIHPNKPVIDSVVLKNLGLKLPGPSHDNRKTETVAVYNRLEKALNQTLQAPSWPSFESMFDRAFPAAAGISSLKKLDLILWQLRGK